MAFALTKVRAYGIEAEQPLNKRYQQMLVLSYTALNTDTALDIGNYAGTFWTAVSGTEPGKTALAALKDISSRCDTFVDVGGTALAGKIPAASGLISYDSAASAGGAASETYAVVGLAVADKVLSVTPLIAAANAVSLRAVGAIGAGTLVVTYSADPGAGGKVRVLVQKAAASAGTLIAGQYALAMDGTNVNLPSLTFVTTDAPTTGVIVLQWDLKDAAEPVQAYAST
jgi:hypothetical protein